MQPLQQAYSRHSSQSDLSDNSDSHNISPYGSFQPSALQQHLASPMSLALPPQAAYAPRPLDPLGYAHSSAAAAGYQPHYGHTISPVGSLGHLSDFSHHTDDRPSLSPTDFRAPSSSQRSPEPGPSRAPPAQQRSPALGLPTLSSPAGAAGPAPAQGAAVAIEPPQPASNNPDFAQTFYDPFRIKHRRRTTPGQLKILESHFEVNAKPDVTLRKSLAEQLEMTPREVQVWFQNRRAKTKKLREKAEKDGAPASGGAEDGADGALVRSPQQLSSPRSHKPAPPPLGLPPNLTSGSTDFAALRRGSSPAILTHVGGGRHLDLPTASAPAGVESFAAQQHAFGNGSTGPSGAQDEQPFLYQPAQLQLPMQAARQDGQQFALPTTGMYPASAQAQAPLVDAYAAPLESVQPFQAQPHLDANGRRFSMPAYHPGNYAIAPNAGTYDSHARLGSQQSSVYSSTDGGTSLLDPNALMGPTTDDMLSPVSTNPSPNFAAFEHGGYKDGADLSPSSSADELAGSQDYGHHSQQQQTFAFGGQPSHYQQQQQQQQQPVYSMASYTFGAATSVAPDASNGPQYVNGQDLSLSPDGFNHDHGRRASLNTAFNGLGLQSPQQPAPGWGSAAQCNYLAPQLPQGQGGVPLTAAAHQALLQKRHSVAVPSMAGYSMASGGSFVPGGASMAGLNGQGLPSYAPQQYLGPNAGNIAAGRRGSTSSLLGTISEQPAGLPGTRLAYGVTAQEVGDGEFGPPPAMSLERRGSLAGPTARKARSQTQLRSSPYGQPHGQGQDPNRRSPGLGGAVNGERRGSAVGLEYNGAY